jgi:hypothetical protein
LERSVFPIAIQPIAVTQCGSPDQAGRQPGFRTVLPVGRFHGQALRRNPLEVNHHRAPYRRRVVTAPEQAAPVHQAELRRSGSGWLDAEARRPEVLTPADWAGRGPVEAGPLPEDEAAVQTLGRFHAQPLSCPPERAGDVGKVIGDLLLRDPDEARELVGSAWARAEVAKERLPDGDRALGRWALTAWRSHPARVLHFGLIGLRTIGTGRSGKPTCSSGGRRRIHVRHRGIPASSVPRGEGS